RVFDVRGSVLLDQAIPLDRRSPHSRFGDGPDGRRQIGSTPAGGAAQVAGPSREPPHPSTVVNQPDEARRYPPRDPQLPPGGQQRLDDPPTTRVWSCATMGTGGSP